MTEKMFPIDAQEDEFEDQEDFADDDSQDIEDTPETIPDPEMDQAEERIQRLEKILSDIAPGWQVQITRTQPGWAKGYLETIDVSDENQPIDLDYLARTWGGDVLRIRVKDRRRIYVGGCDVHLYSYPPKRWGKPLKSPMDEAEEQKQNPMSGLQNMETMLNIVDRLKGKPDLSTAEVLKLVLKQQNTQAAQAPDMIGQFLSMANAFKQLKGIFGSDSEPEPAPAVDGDNMIGQLNSLLDTYLKLKDTTSNSQPKKLVSGPISNPAPASSILDMVKNLPPDKVAETVLSTVGNLPEETRTKVFQNMLSMLGYDSGEDDEDEIDDETEDDEAGPDLESLDD